MSDRIIYVFIGAVLAWALQQYRIHRSEEINLINEHISEIKKLSEESQEYWLTKPKTKAEETKLAARVRAAHAATGLLYTEIVRICDKNHLKYEELSFHLFHIATGGNFESASRSIDPVRAIDTSNAANDLVHHLRIIRADVISLSRLGRKIYRWSVYIFDRLKNYASTLLSE